MNSCKNLFACVHLSLTGVHLSLAGVHLSLPGVQLSLTGVHLLLPGLCYIHTKFGEEFLVWHLRLGDTPPVVTVFISEAKGDLSLLATTRWLLFNDVWGDNRLLLLEGSTVVFLFRDRFSTFWLVDGELRPTELSTLRHTKWNYILKVSMKTQ